MEEKPRLVLDVWSDYVCPFCYLELPVLDALQAERGDELAIRWHAFELRPDPVPTLDPAGEYLRDTWARSVYPMAESRGLSLRLPPVQPRSRKAFETAYMARDAGLFEPVHRALLKAFFEEGRDIGNIDELIDIGVEQGLDGEALRRALDEGRYAEAVLADQRAARQLGISGVPFAVMSRPVREEQAAPRPIGLSGAAPLQHFQAAATRLLS